MSTKEGFHYNSVVQRINILYTLAFTHLFIILEHASTLRKTVHKQPINKLPLEMFGSRDIRRQANLHTPNGLSTMGCTNATTITDMHTRTNRTTSHSSIPSGSFGRELCLPASTAHNGTAFPPQLIRNSSPPGHPCCTIIHATFFLSQALERKYCPPPLIFSWCQGD